LVTLLFCSLVFVVGEKSHGIDSIEIYGTVAGMSVSGISSGGFMTVQFHVAHSSTLVGAGVIAGGPYWAAQDNLDVAVSILDDPNLVDVNLLITETSYAYAANSIDNPANLKDQPVYMFSGTMDTVVLPEMMQKCLQYYQNYGSNCQTVFNVSAEHSWVTTNYGNQCAYLGSPYINNCTYDMAGGILRHIYGNVALPGTYNSTNLYKVDQTAYVPVGYLPTEISIGPVGYAYIPAACRTLLANNTSLEEEKETRKSQVKGIGGTAGCPIHICFHGCNQNVDDVGTQFVVHSGVNEYAETNNFIVLYPQTIANVLNPQGCWDWWGYTGPDYATKLGPQIITVNNMANALG